jgi:glutaredoxin
MHPYVIIGTPKCSYCNQAKSLLLDKYSDYEYHDLTKKPWLLELFKIAKLKTVPQVFSPEGDLIGGYDELRIYMGEEA